MTTKVEKSIEVNVPVSTAYNQWTQFEEFPQFMGGIQKVTQLDDKRLHWVAEVAGVKREWDATILEQVPDQKIAWAATQGATNAGAVYFTPLGAGRTAIRLSLEYEPEGLVEQVGDKLNIVEKRAEADLEKFKEFIESSGYETGAWRGSVNEGASVGTPGVEAAESTLEDSGKAGLSTKTVVAAAATAAAGLAAASVLKGKSDSDLEDHDTDEIPVSPIAVEVTPEPVTTYATDATAYSTEPTTDSYTGGLGSGAATVDPITASPFQGETATEDGEETSRRI